MPFREFRMVLPKFDNDGRRIDSDVLRDFARKVAGRFGGVSVYPSVLGCNTGADKELQCEKNIILEVARFNEPPEVIEEDRQFWRGLAQRAGVELGQLDIMIQEESDTRTDFVPGELRERLSDKLIEGDIFKKLID